MGTRQAWVCCAILSGPVSREAPSYSSPELTPSDGSRKNTNGFNTIRLLSLATGVCRGAIILIIAIHIASGVDRERNALNIFRLFILSSSTQGGRVSFSRPLITFDEKKEERQAVSTLRRFIPVSSIQSDTVLFAPPLANSDKENEEKQAVSTLRLLILASDVQDGKSDSFRCPLGLSSERGQLDIVKRLRWLLHQCLNMSML